VDASWIATALAHGICDEADYWWFPTFFGGVAD
jgi:hypothetical protein